MARMINLRDILELMHHALDNPAFAQYQLIEDGQEAFFYLFFELGDELHPIVPKRKKEVKYSAALAS